MNRTTQKRQLSRVLDCMRIHEEEKPMIYIGRMKTNRPRWVVGKGRGSIVKQLPIGTPYYTNFDAAMLDYNGGVIPE